MISPQPIKTFGGLAHDVQYHGIRVEEVSAGTTLGLLAASWVLLAYERSLAPKVTHCMIPLI